MQEDMNDEEMMKRRQQMRAQRGMNADGAPEMKRRAKRSMKDMEGMERADMPAEEVNKIMNPAFLLGTAFNIAYWHRKYHSGTIC